MSGFWSRSFPDILDTLVVPIRSDQDNKVETCLLKQSISLLSRPTKLWTENRLGGLEPKLSVCLLAGSSVFETTFHIIISSSKIFNAFLLQDLLCIFLARLFTHLSCKIFDAFVGVFFLQDFWRSFLARQLVWYLLTLKQSCLSTVVVVTFYIG